MHGADADCEIRRFRGHRATLDLMSLLARIGEMTSINRSRTSAVPSRHPGPRYCTPYRPVEQFIVLSIAVAAATISIIHVLITMYGPIVAFTFTFLVLVYSFGMLWTHSLATLSPAAGNVATALNAYALFANQRALGNLTAATAQILTKNKFAWDFSGSEVDGGVEEWFNASTPCVLALLLIGVVYAGGRVIEQA